MGMQPAPSRSNMGVPAGPRPSAAPVQGGGGPRRKPPGH
jgi:hypothetical protein